MSTIRINNKVYTGNNMTVQNNKVYIDGKLQDQGDAERNINIVVEGNIDKLSADCCDKIVVNGNCGSVKTTSGDVACGNVAGSIETMSGDVIADDIAGSVTTMSGDIKCKSRSNDKS